MAGLCDGRIVVVTGAGRGIGRGHALEFARQGAKVVVNDLGAEVDGTGANEGPAHEVVEEIKAMGGEAVVNGDDVSDWDGSKRMIDTAIQTFGGLDVVVNNAGILRDRMLANMTESEWDSVIKVHLKGTFCPSRHAVEYWRNRAKEGGTNDARIINTSSTSGIVGNQGQTNYGAAKAAIAAFSVIAAQEMARYGVTVNAIAPGAGTRMTNNLAGAQNRPEVAEGDFDARDAENVAPIVVWLGSSESAHVTGQVFGASGGSLNVWENWDRGGSIQQDARFDPVTLGPIVDDLLKNSKEHLMFRQARARAEAMAKAKAN